MFVINNFNRKKIVRLSTARAAVPSAFPYFVKLLFARVSPYALLFLRCIGLSVFFYECISVYLAELISFTLILACIPSIRRRARELLSVYSSETISLTFALSYLCSESHGKWYSKWSLRS